MKGLQITLALVMAIVPAMAQASGGILRRSSSHCAPVVSHNKAVIVDQAAVFAQPYVPSAPIIVQNNYPPVPATIQSVYGYSYGPGQALPQQLGYNPFQVDPNQLLREAARLTDRSQNLASESLQVYQRLGTDALGQAGLVAQLQARAALIESSKPVVTQELRSEIRTSSAGEQPQAQVDQSGMICLVPDGRGGYRIVQGGVPSLLAGEAASEGVSVLQSRCAACHTGSGSQGGFRLFDDAGQLVNLTNEQKQKVVNLTRQGVMPPQADAAGNAIPELSDVEMAAIQLLFR